MRWLCFAMVLMLAGCVDATPAEGCTYPLPDGSEAQCEAPIGPVGGPVPDLADGWRCIRDVEDGPGRHFMAYTDGTDYGVVLDFDRVKEDAVAFYRLMIKGPDDGFNQYWSSEQAGFKLLEEVPDGRPSTVAFYYVEARLLVEDEGVWRPVTDASFHIEDVAGDAYYTWRIDTDAGPFWMSPMLPRDAEGRHDQWMADVVEAEGPDGRDYLGDVTTFGFRYSDLDMADWDVDSDCLTP